VRDTVLATMSAVPAAGAVSLQLLDRRNALLQNHLLLLERLDLQLGLLQIRFCAVSLLISAFSLFSWFCQV